MDSLISVAFVVDSRSLPAPLDGHGAYITRGRCPGAGHLGHASRDGAGCGQCGDVVRASEETFQIPPHKTTGGEHIITKQTQFGKCMWSGDRGPVPCQRYAQAHLTPHHPGRGHG